MKNETTIISVLLVFLTGLYLLTNRAFAQLTDWQYITPVTIYENSGSNLTDYQVLLTFDTQTPITAGKMNSDGSDIRFAEDVNGVFLLNYWIESGINTNSTNIWVKVPFIPTFDSVIIYLFYGNLSATPQSTLSIFTGPHSSTDSITGGSTNNPGNWQRGFRFSPTEEILLSYFGKNVPDSITQRIVTLFDFSSQVIIHQDTIQPGANWVYKQITNPFWLLTGQEYIITLFGAAGEYYYYQPSSQAGQHINYVEMRYCGSCTQNTFPTSTLANYHYGYPDFLYYTRSQILPEPTVNIGAESLISSLVITNDTSICIASSVNLTVTITDSAGFPAPYTFLWSPAAGLSCTACQSPVASPASTTTYMVMVTDSSGAQDSAFVTVTIFSIPPVADAGLDTTICEKDTVQLNASGGAYYSWNPGTGLSDSTIANPLANPVTTTIYEVSVSNGCGIDVDSITITVNPLPVLASTDTAICPGDTLQLNASGGVSYLWSPGSSLSDSAIANPVASPSVSTNYILFAATGFGCTLIDSVVIIVDSVSQILATTSKDTICPGDSAQLNVLSAFTCDDYNISTISFAPVPGAGTPVSLSDDQTSSVLPIGFTFNFYCNDYTQFYISSNGFIGFSAGMNQGCCTGQLLPNPANPNNLIAFAWEDLDPGAPGGGTVEYFTVGAAPNRILVVNFISVPHFPGPSPNLDVTIQMLLYEGSNAIEIHTTAMPTDGGGHTMGIENIGGTIAHVVPGRNSNGGWSAFNEGIRFTQLSIPDTSLTYSWTPSTGLSNPNIIDPMASPSITTTYIVNAIIGSCSSSDTITIYLDTSNFITATPVTAICEGDSVQLSVTGSAGLPDTSSWTYAWSPESTLTDTTAAAPLAFPASTTTYQITVSNVCGIYTDAVTVTVNPAPTVDAGVDTSYCFGDSVKLEALGAISFVWSPAGGLSCTTCPKPTASPSSTTTYYVTGTAANGCTNTDSITVTVNGSPITATSSIDTICPGDSTQLNVVTSMSIFYDDFDPGIDSSLWLSILGGAASTACGSVSGNALYFDFLFPPREAVTNGLDVSIGGTVSFYLKIGSGAAPCDLADFGEDILLEYSIDGGVTWILINTYFTGSYILFTPITEIIPAGAQTASTQFRWSQPIFSIFTFDDNWAIDEVEITAGGGALDSSAIITWSPSTGLSDSTIADPLASPTTTTTYVVSVGDSSCFTSDTITVYVDNTVIFVTADMGLCTGDSVQIIAASNNPIVSWSWSPATGLSDTAINDPFAKPAVTTTYTVTAVDALGCQFTKNITVSVAPYPTANFTHSDSGLTVAFTDSSVNAGTWVWDFGDGFTSGLLNPTYTYAAPGTYNACLIVTNACTSDTLCEAITVTDCPLPLALFGYSVSGLTTDFSDLSINATSWSWDFGDGTPNDTNQSPSHTYPDTGTYNVCLTVTNACGSDNKCEIITITDCQFPVAAFGYGISGLNVDFSDLSLNATGWLWIFGDGTPNDTNQSPSHTYADTGTRVFNRYQQLRLR